MDPLWWVVTSAFSALTAGGLVYFIMQSRMEVLLAQQREELAGAKSALAAQKEALEESLKQKEDSVRRKAMDEFLADIRVEERHYVREHKMLFLNRKCLVRQERIFFRNIPLSNWVEQEMPFEEGADMEKLAATMSVFAAQDLLGPSPHPIRKLLR
ncbi:MAG TPA: hypothetical protein VHB50_05050 [Bryobacteraceae bacterium]|jgi:hypothetical protein|nr:hypothetical protein [Bryobacteraceae bacterium]